MICVKMKKNSIHLLAIMILVWWWRFGQSFTDFFVYQLLLIDACWIRIHLLMLFESLKLSSGFGFYFCNKLMLIFIAYTKNNEVINCKCSEHFSRIDEKFNKIISWFCNLVILIKNVFFFFHWKIHQSESTESIS